MLGSDKTYWSLIVINIAERLALHYISTPASYGSHAIIVSLTNKLASCFGWEIITIREMDRASQQSTEEQGDGGIFYLYYHEIFDNTTFVTSQSTTTSVYGDRPYDAR